MQVGLVILVLALIGGGGAVAAVGGYGLLGKLRPNPWAGIRTRYTMESEENWYRTHRAAGPIMLLGSIPVASVGLAFLPFVLLDKIDAAILIGVSLGSAFILAGTAVLAAWYGVSMAKAK